MRKKIIFLAACSLLVFSLVLAGCGSDNNGTENSTQQTAFGNGASNSKSTSSTASKPSSAPSATKKVSVTIPEGFTFDQIAKRLEANGVCSAADFYNVSQKYTPNSFSIPNDPNRAFKMEGYLYPATYTFNKGADPQEVLIEMLNAYRNNTGGKLTDKQLNVASIVQMETRSPDQMAIIAGIIYNRLERGMPLQMDSTREYINNYVTKNPLLSNTAKYAPIYNTYKCKALPAGPICSPGADAINAAINPAKTDALYFFFGNDNKNHYSKTYQEHQAAIAQFGVQYGESLQ